MKLFNLNKLIYQLKCKQSNMIIQKMKQYNFLQIRQFQKKMNRKIKTSNSRRRFLHEEQNNSIQYMDGNVIRPPTSQGYKNLYNYRSSSRIRNQYESNYFTSKLLNDRKNEVNIQKEKQINHNNKQQNNRLINIRSKLIQQQQLPKGIKIVITQIKVLLKNNLCDEQQIKEIIKGLVKKIKQMLKQNEQLKQLNNKYLKDIQELKDNMKQVNLKIKEINQNKNKPFQQKYNKDILAKFNQELVNGFNSGINSKPNVSNLNNLNNNYTANNYPLSKYSKTNKNKQPTQFQLILQNLHLTQLNQSYLNTIKQLKQLNGQQKIQIKKQIRDSDSSTQILRYHNRINYLQMKITNSQNIQNQLNTQNQSLIYQLDNLKQQIIQLKTQITNLKQKLNQWRERAFMQKQDSQTNINRQNFLLFSIKKLRQVNKNLTDKLLNITTEDGVKKLKQLQPNPYFQYQVDFFKSLKSVYFQAKLKQYKLSIQNKKDSFQIQPMGLQQQYLDYRKHQQINLVSLNYFKPTFFSFIQQCVTNDIYTCRVKGSTSVSRIFIQVLRGILNCKINQFFLTSGQQKYTRFPQFVYSWFQKFYFNSQKNQICALQPYMQKPISQDIFYRDLMNVKLDQSWQIITFRQFLLQQLNLEELYFYLMCQNLLYKKAGINQQIQYLGQFCIFVQFSAAKSVLDLVLSDFESWNVSFLTSKLRQKIIIKKNIEFIQSGFFLRCLIQYYKIQRINRYKYIAKLCDQFKSCQQNGLRFSSFISVINRFTQISSQQKIRIYRNCYSVGRGKITADIIFTVCTQQLVFLRYLKLKCFYKLPTLISYKELRKNKKKTQQQEQKSVVTKKQIICVQPSDSYIYEIFIGLNKLLTNEKSFTKRIQKLGVSQILQHFESIKRLFGQRSSNNDSSLLRCKHFVHFISSTMNKIREISFQNFYDLLQENNKKKGESSFWIEISQVELCEIFVEQFKMTFDVFEKINNYRLWKQKVYNFRVNNAARKIQRQVRKKFIEPFMQLYKIIYSQIKKDDDATKKQKAMLLSHM